MDSSNGKMNMKTFIIMGLIVLLLLIILQRDYFVFPLENFSFNLGEKPCYTSCNTQKDSYNDMKSSSKCSVRKERYTTRTSEGHKFCGSPLNTCDKKWDVGYSAGANGTCSDSIWHTTEPRAIFVDNRMKCKDFEGDYKAPSGF